MREELRLKRKAIVLNGTLVGRALIQIYYQLQEVQLVFAVVKLLALAILRAIILLLKIMIAITGIFIKGFMEAMLLLKLQSCHLQQ